MSGQGSEVSANEGGVLTQVLRAKQPSSKKHHRMALDHLHKGWVVHIEDHARLVVLLDHVQSGNERGSPKPEVEQPLADQPQGTIDEFAPAGRSERRSLERIAAERVLASRLEE